VLTGESFAENPELIDAASNTAASTTAEQKRLNAINSSPAEIPTQIPGVEAPANVDP
jgi:hypothetical protein